MLATVRYTLTALCALWLLVFLFAAVPLTLFSIPANNLPFVAAALAGGLFVAYVCCFALSLQYGSPRR